MKLIKKQIKVFELTQEEFEALMRLAYEMSDLALARIGMTDQQIALIRDMYFDWDTAE